MADHMVGAQAAPAPTPPLSDLERLAQAIRSMYPGVQAATDGVAIQLRDVRSEGNPLHDTTWHTLPVEQALAYYPLAHDPHPDAGQARPAPRRKHGRKA